MTESYLVSLLGDTVLARFHSSKFCKSRTCAVAIVEHKAKTILAVEPIFFSSYLEISNKVSIFGLYTTTFFFSKRAVYIKMVSTPKMLITSVEKKF